VEGRNLRYLNALPRFILNLPKKWRVCIVILSILLSQALFILLPRPLQNPGLFTIPVVIIAWIGRRYGTFLAIVSFTILTWIYYAIITHKLLLSQIVFNSFILNNCILLIIGLLISSQRNSFEKAEEQQHQFARAYEQEQQLNKAKDQFIQNVNHELRTPLTALSGYLELLLEHNDYFANETRASFLRNAVLSCEELQLLVNSILDTLQINNDPMPVPLTDLPLAPIIREIIQRADPRWRLQEKVQLEIPEEIRVQAHPQYLRQILRNLLSNAVKYAPDAQRILINARKIEKPLAAKPEICISIRDFGPGIPLAEISQLFGQFVRLQRDTMGVVRGTGLGLYICQQLTEAMSGSISVKSSGIPGEGCCFYIMLLAAAPLPLSLSPTQEHTPVTN
jgi:signal transduction histidine kinase